MMREVVEVMERWRSVTFKGCEHYEVSDTGRVRSPRGMLSPCPVQGYPAVTLPVGGCSQTITVHRLVLLSFAGPPRANHECCHGNGYRNDNRLSNLRWGTRSENHLDTALHGSLKLTIEAVSGIRKMIAGGSTHLSAGKAFGVCKVYAGQIARRERCVGYPYEEATP